MAQLNFRKRWNILCEIYKKYFPSPNRARKRCDKCLGKHGLSMRKMREKAKLKLK